MIEASVPLNLSTAFVMDKTEHFYAIGNTPPQQLIPPKENNPKILCLAAGDLRGCLFSISRTPKNSYESVSFVINDCNPAILARNILLLALCLHPKKFGCNTLDIWALWYSLLIKENQWTCAVNAMHVLLDNDSFLDELHISVPGGTLKNCREVWSMWIEMDMSPFRAMEMKEKHVLSKLKCSKNDLNHYLQNDMHSHFVREGYIGECFIFPDETLKLPGIHPFESELLKLISTFQFNNSVHKLSKETSLVVNNTLFMNQDSFNLHYTSDFFKSFHLWRFQPKEKTLEQYCQNQHAEWINNLQKCASKLHFEFVLGDCNSICLGRSYWQAHFHVIDTSNVCDHVGLAGLLLACRPLVASNGVLITTSMKTHVTDSFNTWYPIEESYLKKQLIVDPNYWPDVYGWSCHGYEEGIKAIHIEWPLVSPLAPIKLQWYPMQSNDIAEEQILAVTTALMDPNRHEISYYSTGVAVLFLLRRTRSPIEFLHKFQSRLRKENLVELELWLSQITSKPRKFKVVEIIIHDSYNLCASISQPWLRAQGILLGRSNPESFSIMTMEKASTGKTSAIRFIAPESLDVSSVKLCNFNTISHAFSLKANEVMDNQFNLTLPFHLDEAHNYTFDTLKSSKRDNPFSWKGLIDWTNTADEKRTFPSSSLGQMGLSMLQYISSKAMLKEDLLLTRSQSLDGVSDDFPFLSIKELLMSLAGDGKSREAICIHDGAGTIPLVITKEGIYQDEKSGTPQLDLTMFFPNKPFSSSRIPLAIEKHHPSLSECTLSWKTRKYLKEMVESMAGSFKETENAWGEKGIIHRLLFPLLFPTRNDEMKELHRQVNLEARLKVLKSSNQDKVKALKQDGNSLMKEKRFEDAIFSYMVAAMKIENVDSEDSESMIEIIAQCHCNMALAHLNIGTKDAIMKAIRNCTYAMHLLPKWGKPYYRRALCFEKQGQLKHARKDLKIAMKLCPNDSTVHRAILRVNSDMNS